MDLIDELISKIPSSDGHGCKCPWCKNPNTNDDSWSDDFCRTHEAEYLGHSVAEMDRGEAVQHAEYLDTLN
jgi:hypothetical protein